MIINLLKRLIAGKELDALERYRLACIETRRFNASIIDSALTAEMIEDFGEGRIALDSFEFRAKLQFKSNLKIPQGISGTKPAPLPKVSPAIPPEVKVPPRRCYCESCD